LGELQLNWAKSLKDRSTSLSKSEKGLVDYINAYPEYAARLSQKSLAEAAGVSKPVVISCYRNLGYENFRSFQESIEYFFSSHIDSHQAARNMLNQVHNLEELLTLSLEVELRSFERLKGNLDSGKLEKVTRALKASGNVFILGEATGQYPAHYLSQRLTRYRIPVLYIDQDMRHFADRLYPLSEGDTLILFFYSDKDLWLRPLLKFCAERKARSVLISGIIHPDFVTLSDYFFHVPRGELSFKNSMALPMYFSNMLLLAMDVLYKDSSEKDLADLESLRSTWDQVQT